VPNTRKRSHRLYVDGKIAGAIAALNEAIAVHEIAPNDRDAGSVINMKEPAAVDARLDSDRHFHVPRDYYSHKDLMLAGMWSGRPSRGSECGCASQGETGYGSGNGTFAAA
jgi:hypothetical protein